MGWRKKEELMKPALYSENNVTGRAVAG